MQPPHSQTAGRMLWIPNPVWREQWQKHRYGWLHGHTRTHTHTHAHACPYELIELAGYSWWSGDATERRCPDRDFLLFFRPPPPSCLLCLLATTWVHPPPRGSGGCCRLSDNLLFMNWVVQIPGFSLTTARGPDRVPFQVRQPPSPRLPRCGQSSTLVPPGGHRTETHSSAFLFVFFPSPSPQASSLKPLIQKECV